MVLLSLSKSKALHGYSEASLAYTFNAFICAMVKGVNAASLPPTINLSVIPEPIQATPFNIACNAVEQVIEWLISGP